MEYLTGIMILAPMAVLVGCFITVGRVLIRLNAPKRFMQYVHHGVTVWVRADLRDRHRDHCLCYDCKRFHPGSAGNCRIADQLYNVCVTNDLVTPVWECKRFVQNPNAID